MTDPAASAPYLFISYASAERERALAVADAIEGAGVSVWIDRESITGGSSWGAEIVRGIKRCAALAVLCSPASLRSSNVQRELNLAVEDDKPILPLILAPGDPPDEVRYAIAGRQWIELFDRPADAWLPNVLRALARLGVGNNRHVGAVREPPAGAPPTVATPTSAPQAGATPTGAPPAGAPPAAVLGGSRTAPTSTNDLPAQATSFVGREQELAAVAGLLAGARLVTLTGPGGTGKTRLALAAAEQVQDGFPDGVVFVELGALNDAELVSGAVAQTLGLGESSGQSPADAVTAYLRRRALLLVLDNFEQVTGAAGFVRALLAGSTALKLLLTSRTVLRLPGEREYPVPPLPLPPAGLRGDAAALARSPAVALFAQRAQDARPDFALNEENAAAVSEICRRLDGLPLAIELAAARVRVLTPTAMLGRLDNSLKLLTGGSRALPERQQTLRGAIQWSYDLLDTGEQALFRRLSIFAGGFTLESGESIAYSPLPTASVDVLDGIESLVEKSLLRRGEESAGGEPRFSMLGTIRAFGLEQLEAAGELDAARDAHAAYYLTQAEAAEPHLWTAGRDPYLEWIDTELDDLRQAFERLRAGENPEPAARLIKAIRVWLIRHNDEGRRWTTGALARLAPLPAPPDGDATGGQARKLARAWVLLVAGVCAGQWGDFAIARGHLGEAVRLSRGAGDDQLLALALANLGSVSRSPELAEEGIDLARGIGDGTAIAMSLNLLGMTFMLLSNHSAAESAFHESDALFRTLGDRWGQAMPLGNLGLIAYERGELGRARASFEDARTVFEVNRDRRNLAIAHSTLAQIGEETGDWRAAAAHWTQAIEFGYEAGPMYSLALGLAGAGRLGATNGHAIDAARVFGAAQRLFDQSGLPLDPERRGVRLWLSGPETVRAALGAAAYDAAFAEGQALSQDETVALAQAELSAFIAENGGPGGSPAV